VIGKIPVSCAAVLLGFLSGCSTYSGTVEFSAYRTAFQSAQVSSEAILDRLAVAERSLYSRCVNIRDILDDDDAKCEEFDPEVSRFNPDDAFYIAEAGDPPGTAAYRRMIRSVAAYTEILNGLASGQTADMMAGQLGELAAAAVSAGSAVVPPAAGAATASLTAINTTIAALKPITTQVLGFQTRAAFREEFLANKDKIRQALTEARNGTGLMYDTIVNNIIDTAPPSGVSEAAKKQIANHRLILANWVVILDTTIDAFDLAVAAAENQSSASVSGLLAASNSIAEAAQDVRRTLAASDSTN
jgi:hypothetical protein